MITYDTDIFFQNYSIYSTNFDNRIKNKTSVQPVMALQKGEPGAKK